MRKRGFGMSIPPSTGGRWNLLKIAVLVGILGASSSVSAKIIRGAGEDFEFFTHNNYRNQLQFEDIQERARDRFSTRGQRTIQFYGPIATEVNYTYLYCRLVLPEGSKLFIPEGTGHFTVIVSTKEGLKEVSDLGVLVWIDKELRDSRSEFVFVNPDRTFNTNENNYPRVVLRFFKGAFKYKNIVGLRASSSVITQPK